MYNDCDVYRSPQISTFAASILIAIGIIISYIPQYRNIIATRSSFGLAPSFLFLNAISGFSATANLVLLSFISLPCCSELSQFECVNSQVSLIQVGLQTIATFTITVLCVLYTSHEIDEHRKVVRVLKSVLFFVIFLCVSIFTTYTAASSPSTYYSYAKLLGIFSTITTLIQYFPQLYTTYKLKKSGVLSIQMMCIQFPGGLVWSTTLILKPGSHWSSWLPYLSAAIIQGVLLILSIYYDYYYQNCNDEMDSLIIGNEEDQYH